MVTKKAKGVVRPEAQVGEWNRRFQNLASRHRRRRARRSGAQVPSAALRWSSAAGPRSVAHNHQPAVGRGREADAAATAPAPASAPQGRSGRAGDTGARGRTRTAACARSGSRCSPPVIVPDGRIGLDDARRQPFEVAGGPAVEHRAAGARRAATTDTGTWLVLMLVANSSSGTGCPSIW